MRKFILPFLLAVIFAAPPSEAYAPKRIPARISAVVKRVTDGDTLTCMVGRKKEKVRLIGVDTPEMHDSKKLRRDDRRDRGRTRREIIALGRKAKAFTLKRVPPGTKVELEPDVRERDKYGRLLAYVWYREGGRMRMLNADLIEDGMARTMTIPPNVRYADMFYKLQVKARGEGRGIWAR